MTNILRNASTAALEALVREKCDLVERMQKAITRINEQDVEIERLTAALANAHEEYKNLEEALVTCRELREFDRKEIERLRAIIHQTFGEK